MNNEERVRAALIKELENRRKWKTGLLRAFLINFRSWRIAITEVEAAQQERINILLDKLWTIRRHPSNQDKLF
jgi:hypothetical protein